MSIYVVIKCLEVDTIYTIAQTYIDSPPTTTFFALLSSNERSITSDSLKRSGQASTHYMKSIVKVGVTQRLIS